jgi:DNA polymerase-4
MQKPDGLTVLPPESLPQAILHLKLQDICGIGTNMEVRLQRAGIRDVAGLWAAGAQFLKRVWNGVTGLRFHALLHGVDLPSRFIRPGVWDTSMSCRRTNAQWKRRRPRSVSF